MRLLRASFPDRPAFDMAVSAALLQRVAAGELDPTLRLHRQRPAVAFGKLDALADGFGDAVATARARGFEPFERLAGGRAAVYHEGTLAIGEVVVDPEANIHIQERYAVTAEVLVDALASLGVDARVGEVPGEYCPGDFSVNARGERKLTGTAQRVVRGAAYVGTVIVVRDAARTAEVVREVYGGLGLDVSPAATGAVEDEAPGVSVDDLEAALVDAYGRHHALEAVELDERTLALAAELEPRFTIAR